MSDEFDKIYIDADDDESVYEKTAKAGRRILVFALGDEIYCVDVPQTKEVIRLPELTRVPNVPPFVLGVANLRGEILSILDLHYFFGLERKGTARNARVIVTDVSGPKIGLLVDEVRDTVEVAEENIQEPLATLKGRLVELTKGQIPYGNDIYTLLDFERLLACDEIRNLRKGEGL